MICCLVTHNRSGKQYIGISNRDLAVRKAEHESHSKSGTSDATFHSALRKYGKDAFTWKVLIEGDEEIIKILERVPLGKWETFTPKGFNSVNEASEFELPTDSNLSLAQYIDTGVAEMEMVYDLLNVLDTAMNNQRLTQKTKELIKPLISHLKKGDCLNDA